MNYSNNKQYNKNPRNKLRGWIFIFIILFFI